MSKCEKCKHNNDESFFVCDTCIHDTSLKDRFEPQTNADRIRAMSDEELAKLFCGFCKNAKICEGCPMCDGKCAESELAESWVEWLKQPAKE